MEVMNESPHKIYIKSNTVTVMRFLFFLSVVLLVLVAGLCIFVVFGSDDTNNYHWHKDGQFYYTLDDGAATIVKYVDDDATEYTIPSSVNYGGKNYPVTTVGANAFTNHRTLTAVTIPDSVTKIMGDAKNQKGAFSGCTALTTVNLGQSVANIETYAFKNCVALQAVRLPAGVQFVQDGAFQNCLALESIELNGNGILGTDCFANCMNVTTLKLGNDVRLTDGTRQVVAGLTALTSFDIAESNPVYQEKNGCLLTNPNIANDTVVLGVRGADVPDGVTKILDWAWGTRAANKMFVPSNVLTVGKDSFDSQLIYTDATAKPSGWLTNVPVYTDAQLVTFVAEGDKTATAYIYRNQEREWVYPKYDDLFAEKPATPFLKWSELLSGITCDAIYQSTATADTNSIDELKDALADAKVYLDDADVCLKLTIDCWENFKTLYYRALDIDTSSAYQYVVDDAAQSLQKATQQIKNALDGTGDKELLESTDWRVGLQNLVNVIDQLDFFDLVMTEENLSREKTVIAMAETARDCLVPNSGIDEATGNLVWRDLRAKFEGLTVDIGTDSRLGKEIAACEKLDKANYTAESWENLQNYLANARQVTSCNLSISAVRRALENARADLREVTLADNLLRLNTWVSVCQDLAIKDYQADEYDRLFINVHLIMANANDLVTNAKVASAINDLQNDYRGLVEVNNTTVYDNSTGILNKNSLPYFIVAVILFTGAVVAGAAAGAMKHQLRQSQE